MRSALADLTAAVAGVRSVLTDIQAQANANPLDMAAAKRHEIIQGAMTVVLSGFFEAFLKDCAKDFVVEIESLARPFHSLPLKLRRIHFEQGGQILSNKAKNRVSWVSATSEDIAHRLGDAIGNPAAKPLWEAFANTKGNPGGSVVLEFLKNVGVTNPHLKIDTQAGVPKWQQIKLALDVFIQSRNQCAHTGKVANAPSAAVVLTYCDLVDELSEYIVQVLEHHLTVI